MKDVILPPEFTHRERQLLELRDKLHTPVVDSGFAESLVEAYKEAEATSLRTLESLDDAICREMLAEESLLDESLRYVSSDQRDQRNINVSGAPPARKTGGWVALVLAALVVVNLYVFVWDKQTSVGAIKREGDRATPTAMVPSRPLAEPCDLPQGQLWGGADEELYILPGSSSASREGPDDLTVPTAHGTTVSRLSHTTEIGESAGATPLSLSNTNGTTEGVVDYLDMNGDGFPDVVGHGAIQYTSSRGTLGGSAESGASPAPATLAIVPAPVGPPGVLDGKVGKSDTLSRVLKKSGLTAAEADEVIRALSGMFDFKTMRAGQTYRIERGVDGRVTLLVSLPLEHRDSVVVAAFSPDSARIVTASADHAAHTWAAATGQPIDPLLVHAGIVYSIAFSPEGRGVVTASGDETSRIWDASTAEPLSLPLVHPSSVKGAAFSADDLSKWRATFARVGAGPYVVNKGVLALNKGVLASHLLAAEPEPVVAPSTSAATPTPSP